MAKKVLVKNAWGYVHGDAGMRHTEDNNLAAFKKWGLVPNRMVQFKAPDLRTEVLGCKLSSPLIIAPVGVSSSDDADEPSILLTYGNRSCKSSTMARSLLLPELRLPSASLIHSVLLPRPAWKR